MGRIFAKAGRVRGALAGKSRPSRMPATYAPTVIPEPNRTRAGARDGPLASHKERELKTA
ncbi:hypothetical protein CS8_101240 [Cupriavidus sp. 8B]